MNKTYIGLDVGKNGYIVAIEQKEIKKFAIPKNGNEVNIKELAEIFQNYEGRECIVCKESLHAIFGTSAGSNYEFGKINGVFIGILSALKIPYVEVTAKKWQAAMFEGIPQQTKLSKGKQKTDTKAMSILACSKLYPSFDLRGTERSKVANHNLADALLLATYIKKQGY